MRTTHWGVQLDDAGSMDFYDSEDEARRSARGAPIWKVTYQLQEDVAPADTTGDFGD